MARCVVAFILLLSMIACAGAPDDTSADLAALQEFVSHAGEAVNAGDAEAQVNRFTEDGIYMWPNAPEIRGREELREFFEDRFARFEVELESESLELVLSGDWAFERGKSVARILPRSGGEVKTVHGKYLNVLRKQKDGTWRVARRIRNADHPTNP